MVWFFGAKEEMDGLAAPDAVLSTGFCAKRLKEFDPRGVPEEAVDPKRLSLALIRLLQTG